MDLYSDIIMSRQFGLKSVGENRMTKLMFNFQKLLMGVVISACYNRSVLDGKKGHTKKDT